MNHPDQSTWIAYLYGETPPEQRTPLGDHLEECAECRARFETWQTTQQALDQWTLQAIRPRNRRTGVIVRWALAASVVFAVGLAVGRGWTPSAASLRAELLPLIRQDLRAAMKVEAESVYRASRPSLTNEIQQLVRGEIDRSMDRAVSLATTQSHQWLDDTVRAWASAREEDRQATRAMAARLERQHRNDTAWLRRDLETVALVTDTRLQSAQSAIGQLASYNANENLSPISIPSTKGN